MITSNQVLTYFFLAFMLSTTLVEAASQKTYDVQVITLADSTRPSQPTLPKKYPLEKNLGSLTTEQPFLRLAEHSITSWRL